ncbi:PfkB family carbohydrate kinase [Nocardioides sp.]|uniref:PfkB family carbohydrate kinase n=1 Tax=Nocardioides sp. TaxID=35761 RepID=UPI002737440B|nr:PfkB family carbohydrate kinase [Nocardioides sp.]MDP3894782.1 PfkB family carbohydrate kinase [Nocardioides sp.]
MTEPLICVVGSINEDTTIRVPVLPAAGETALATGRTRSGGGKGANQAAAAAAMGARVAFVGAVGDDDAGRLALESLESRSIDVSHVSSHPLSATGTAVILVGDDGENLIVVDQGANALLDASTVRAAVEQLAPAVTLGQLEVPIDCLAAAAEATGAGVFLLNPAPMSDDPSELDEVLAMADVVMPNRSELGRLARRATPLTAAEVDACVAVLDVKGAVVVTLGSQGAVVYDQGHRTEVAALSVDAVDTSGAGDVFCGVLAHRLASGDELVAAVRRANTSAARSTTLAGAQVPADFTG